LTEISSTYHKNERKHDELMRIDVGCDLEEYKRHYGILDDLHSYFRTFGLDDVVFGELGSTEEEIMKRDPSHLIVWRENNEIMEREIAWIKSSTVQPV
jgi:hypothetical protein